MVHAAVPGIRTTQGAACGQQQRATPPLDVELNDSAASLSSACNPRVVFVLGSSTASPRSVRRNILCGTRDKW